MLVILRDLGIRYDGVKRRRYLEVRCRCGFIFETRKQAVTRKDRPMKGCRKCGTKEMQKQRSLQSKQLKKEPLYRVWEGIKKRCYNPNAWNYKYYGGKGVVMCNEWLNSSATFIAWGKSNGYQKGMHIDKDVLSIKNNISPPIYSPSTCQFLTQRESIGERNTRVAKNKALR